MASEIQKLADSRRVSTANRVASALATGILDGTGEYGRYSTWLLAAAGATAIATISNTEALVAQVGEPALAFAGLILVLSGLLGFAAKSREQLVLAYVLGRQAFAAHAESVLDEHDATEKELSSVAPRANSEVEADVLHVQVMVRFLGFFPQPVRWMMSRSIRRFSSSPEASIQDAIRSFVLQVTYTNLQAAALVGFYLVAIVLGVGN